MELGLGKKARYYLIAIYKPDEKNDKRVKILGRYFIKKNKDKAKIIYKNKIYELKEYFEDIDTNYNHKDLIKFKIIFIHNIIDMSYMFYECNSLMSLPDISNLNLSRVNSMKHMFCGCKSLISLLHFYILNKYKNYIIFEVTYKNNEDERKVNILDNNFIKRNKDNGSIIYNNSEYELKEYFEAHEKMNKDTFKLLICLDKNIKDISYIFYECKSLISIDYYQKIINYME